MAKVEVFLNSKKVDKFLDQIGKNFKNVEQVKKDWGDAAAAIFIKDYDNHFEKEMGPDGKWSEWSTAYTKSQRKRGKGSNKILQDTRHMFQGFKESNWRKEKRGIRFFNNAKTKGGFPYAAHHDETAKKTRPFMWLSSKALEEITSMTLKFLERKV